MAEKANKNEVKKPIYKKWWFWVIIAVVMIGIIGIAGGNDGGDDKTVTTVSSEQKQNDVLDSEQNKSIPTEYKSALKKAESYSDRMHMSKAAIYDQLVSEYGEKFSKEAAQYAIDHVKADWKANALKQAENYQKTMSMSPAAVYDQLISEYGGKFTKEEAQYAIDNLS